MNCNGTLTQHLSGSYNTLETTENISCGWTQCIPKSPDRIEGVDR